MPSPAARTFHSLETEANNLISTSLSGSLDVTARRIIYRASVVMICAAWESYVEELVICYYKETSPFKLMLPNPHHGIAQDLATRFVGRFHTPNSENVRNLLLQYTGYDPWPDWIWPSSRLNSMQCRDRLNEILRVRHSVAHGTPLPPVNWTMSNKGRSGLSARSAKMCQAFLRQLVAKTDAGMKHHLITRFSSLGVSPAW